MKTEYTCSKCRSELSSKEVNSNDDFGMVVSDFTCKRCDEYDDGEPRSIEEAEAMNYRPECIA